MAADERLSHVKPCILAIAPPYPINAPPAGAAALLGYLKANGCHDFGFLDLRLYVPYHYAPTYRASGVFGETFVIDVPDLPLVLRLLEAYANGEDLIGTPDKLFERYCLERGIPAQALHGYLRQLDTFYTNVFSQIDHLELVGFSCWSSNYLPTLLAAAHLKRRKHAPYIVVGGPQVTESRSSAELGLASGLFDAVVLGEGEETLLSLYEEFRRSGGAPTRHVEGTLVRDSNGAFVSSERKLLRVKELPLPSFDEMPLRSYPSAIPGMKILPYQLSRGCTDECSFCSEWVFWRHFRLGNMSHAVDQIEQLKARYGMQAIWFSDSLLNGQMNRLRDFARELIERKVDVLWGGFMRAQMDAETAALLYKAGLREAFIGIESMSDETLALMNKRRSEADNVHALEAFLETGVNVTGGFIPGFPGDTRERFIDTALVLRDIQRRFQNFTVNVEPFIISPGQPLSSKLEANGLQPKGWDEAYLAIAPRYRAITEKIRCTVSGANQGLDRLGELTIARSISRLTTADQTYGYAQEESLTNQDMKFVHLTGELTLGLCKTEASLTYGLVFTQAEKETYEAQRRAITRFGGSSVLGLEPLATMLRAIEEAHLVVPRRDTPRIMRACFVPQALEPSMRVRFSPFVIARVAPSGEHVLVVDLVTRLRVKLPATAAPVLRQLDVTTTSVADLTAAGAPMELLDGLNRAGFLVADEAFAHAPIPPRPEPTSTEPARALAGNRLPVIS